jgi:hypothetical protein
MLVPAPAQHPQPLQPPADLRARLERLLRQVVAQRPVREAQTETLDQIRMRAAPLLQIRQRLRAPLQRLVVVVHHPHQQRAVFRIRLDQRREHRA